MESFDSFASTSKDKPISEFSEDIFSLFSKQNSHRITVWPQCCI